VKDDAPAETLAPAIRRTPVFDMDSPKKHIVSIHCTLTRRIDVDERRPNV
jgi:hypothetical protein